MSKHYALLRTLGVILVCNLLPVSGAFAAAGEGTFKSNCAACHTVGKGKLVGPDLKGVTQKHSEAWLLKWIKSSQTLVKSGDTAAVALFEANNKMPMPDQALSEEEIKGVLAYIEGAANAVAKAPVHADHVVTNPESHKKVQAAEGNMMKSMGFANYIMFFMLLLLLVLAFSMILALKTLKEEAAHKANSHSQQTH